MAERVAGVVVPDSEMMRAAHAALRAQGTDLLLNHAARVFIFGALIAADRGLQVDQELLFVCAMFHHIGLTAAYERSTERFEIDSAYAARAFLDGFQIATDRQTQVWDAIALHTTPGLSKHKSVLADMLCSGVETDLLGSHFERIDPVARQRTIARYPREADFNERIIEAIGAGLMQRPHTAFGTVHSDVLDRVDPKYHCPNYCGLILGSGWADEVDWLD